MPGHDYQHEAPALFGSFQVYGPGYPNAGQNLDQHTADRSRQEQGHNIQYGSGAPHRVDNYHSPSGQNNGGYPSNLPFGHQQAAEAFAKLATSQAPLLEDSSTLKSFSDGYTTQSGGLGQLKHQIQDTHQPPLKKMRAASTTFVFNFSTPYGGPSHLDRFRKVTKKCGSVLDKRVQEDVEASDTNASALSAADQAYGRPLTTPSEQPSSNEPLYFVCYKCGHPRSNPDGQSGLKDDSCRYCQFEVTDQEPLDEVKWCIVGEHEAVRADFFDLGVVESHQACALHRPDQDEAIQAAQNLQITNHSLPANYFVGQQQPQAQPAYIQPPQVQLPQVQAPQVHAPQTQPQIQQNRKKWTVPKLPWVTPAFRDKGWRVGLGPGEASGKNALLPQILGGVEGLVLFPNSLNDPELLRRYIGNDFTTHELGAIVEWARGRPDRESINRRNGTIRYQKSKMLRASSAMPAAVNYDTNKCTYGSPDENMRLIDLAKNVVKLGSLAYEDSWITTQAVLLAVALHDTVTTVANLPAFAARYRLQYPNVNGVSVLQDPQADQNGKQRVLAMMRVEGVSI